MFVFIVIVESLLQISSRLIFTGHVTYSSYQCYITEKNLPKHFSFNTTHFKTHRDFDGHERLEVLPELVQSPLENLVKDGVAARPWQLPIQLTLLGDRMVCFFNY